MRRILGAALVFLGVFGLYLANLPFDYSKNLSTHSPRRLLTTGDTVGTTFLPYLILKHNTFDYTEILDSLSKYIPVKKYYVIPINDGFYPKYPMLTGFLALPLYVVPILLHKIPNLDTMQNVYKVLFLGRVSAAFYASISVAIFYLILEFLRNKHASKYSKKLMYLFLFSFAFGSNVWTISSRSLWMHTTSQVFISLAVYLLLLGLKNERYIPVTGLLAGLAVLARPTNFVFAAIMALYILFNHRKKLVPFVLWVLPTIFLYFLQNKVLYGNFLIEGYQLGDKIRFDTPLLEGLSGLLFSPGKGFLFVMPLIFVGLFELVKTLLKRNKNRTDILLSYLGLTFIVSLLLMSRWRGWDGADRFGPGLLTEYIPILAVFSFLLLSRYLKKFRKSTIIILLVLTTYSFLIHFNAVVFRKSRCSTEHNWTFYCLSPPKRLPKY